MNLSENLLIERLKSGNDGAFKELVDEYGNMVYNTCLGFIRRKEDAEDISQEVFIEVYKSIEKFRSESKLSTWIYRVAVTKSLDYIRSMKRKKRFAFFKAGGGSGDEIENVKDISYGHPGIMMENKERSKTLFKAIDRLPENQKIAFTLCKVDGLSYDEIADIMETSKSSVESLLHRAKKNLQKFLSKYYEKEFKN